MGTYINQIDLEHRLSAQVLQQIMDDDVNGVPDPEPIGQLIADAEGYVESFLKPIYDIDAIRTQGTSAANEVKRLCLDVAVAYAVDRHPEYVRANGRELMERARRDLIDLRKRLRTLDTEGEPEPAANEGGETRSGDPENPDPVAKVFLDGMGIF